MSGITIWTGDAVRTGSDAAGRRHDAVAVQDRRIVDVGSRHDLVAAHPDAVVDDRFDGHTISPGLIDPHLHPSMAAVLLQMDFTTVVEWDLPWEAVPAIRDETSFWERIVDLDTRLEPGEPLFAWGHHPRWHGDVDRRRLNDVSGARPIVIWHRGYHSLVVNDAALVWMGLDMEAAARHPQIDLDRGAFFENGLFVANQHINKHTLDSERFRGALDKMRAVIHHGGHTTIADAGIGMYDFDAEWGHLQAVMDRPDTPFRVLFMPFFVASGAPVAERIAQVHEYQKLNTRRLQFGNDVKMLADGGFFAELMMLQEPYLDGHHGEWLTAPEQFRDIAAQLWDAEFRTHVHTTGDLGVELALSTLEELQREHPRTDHRFTFEHFGISTPEQIARIATVGAQVSANVYYVHELARVFSDHVLGEERGAHMTRLGSLEAAGVPFALHSDFTMAPAKPLFNAWVATTRMCESGEVIGADERVSVAAALDAVTINAARMIGREHEIGSIEVGKLADFTVLDTDPWLASGDELANIGVMATVFEGELFPIRGT